MAPSVLCAPPVHPPYPVPSSSHALFIASKVWLLSEWRRVGITVCSLFRLTSLRIFIFSFLFLGVVPCHLNEVIDVFT